MIKSSEIVELGDYVQVLCLNISENEMTENSMLNSADFASGLNFCGTGKLSLFNTQES
jgi:hypothetical protein